MIKETLDSACVRKAQSWGYLSPAAPGAILRCLCPDGKVRHATIVSYADTYWTLPARITVKGKTVSGAVSFRGLPGEEKVCFLPGGKNRDLLPPWNDGKGEGK